MTGLDTKKDKIIEVACLVSNGDLTKVAEGLDVALACPKECLDGMDDWCKTTHGNSGLVDRVLASNLTVEQVEQQMIDFVSKYAAPKQCPLAGNSVHADKAFLGMFHYFPIHIKNYFILFYFIIYSCLYASFCGISSLSNRRCEYCERINSAMVSRQGSSCQTCDPPVS